MTANPSTLKFVSSNRRVREDRRFVVGGGRYVADIVLDEMLHVALAPSQHPAARIINIDSAKALQMPGVVHVLTGEALAKAVDPLMNGLDTPKVKRYPLAVGQVRYAGEWVAAVVAETRAQAEDALDAIRIDYEPLPYVVDAEEAITDASPNVHAEHGTNVLLDKTFVWGDVESTLLKVHAISRFA
jgi:2-furoyl-CoA dehydrogenase large subunit